MNVDPSAIECEFTTTMEAEAYDRWFRAQVQEAIEDSRPSISHDQTMARMRAIIAAKREEKRSDNQS